MWFVLRAPKRVTTNDLVYTIPRVVIWRRNHLAGIHHSRGRLHACRARRGAWPGWSGASRRPTCRPQSWRRTTSERSSAITKATRGRWRCKSDGARGCWATFIRGTRPSWSAPVPSEIPPRRSPRGRGCSSRGFSRSARSLAIAARSSWTQTEPRPRWVPNLILPRIESPLYTHHRPDSLLRLRRVPSPVR